MVGAVPVYPRTRIVAAEVRLQKGSIIPPIILLVKVTTRFAFGLVVEDVALLHTKDFVSFVKLATGVPAPAVLEAVITAESAMF
jgi:hypothetical protein